MSMIIRKLEMQGFKSFAERTKVVFHPGITAVVGPNGTGKSNLLDSLLWATGGTRTKSVRGDRIDDVIFNGNAKRPPLNMADVVLTLGDGDDELVISHRVFRNGEGEYKMNGKAVRLKDIQDELWRHQIGEKEYFVIEQGSIGSFVTSKPTEKRLFIEEAAGTAFYKDKRRQAQNKLDNTEQNLTRLEDIIMEVEKQKNSLQRQAQAANRYRRLRERIRELSSTHYCRKLAELENLQTEACKAHAESLEKENAALAQLKDVEKELTDSRGVLWTLEKSLQETQEKLYGLRSRLDRQENEIENDARRIDESGLRIQQSGRDRDELLADLLRLTKEMEETRGQTGGLEEELAARQLEVEQASHETGESRERKRLIDQAIETNRSGYYGRLQALTEIKNERARVEKELELTTRQLGKLSSQADEQARLLKENTDRKERLGAELEAEKDARQKADSGHRELVESVNRTVEKLNTLRAQIKDLQKTRDGAAAELQAVRKLEANERQGARHDEVSGSLGLLADLVRTAPDDAPLFDVFWKDEAGASVVPAGEFLANVPGKIKGRFLLIPEKDRQAVPAALLSSPGVLGLLKSRLESSEKFGAMVGRLDDAVVVDTLSSAVRTWLEYPGFNYISASGDLLLASGLVKAGPTSNGMMVLTSEIRALEKKLSRLDGTIKPLTEDEEKTSRELAALRNSAEQAARELSMRDKNAQEKSREIEFIKREGDKVAMTASIIARELETAGTEKARLEETREKTAGGIETAEQEAAEAKQKGEALEKESAEKSEAFSRAEHDWLEKRSGLALIQEKIVNRRNTVSGLEKRLETVKSKIDQLEVVAKTAEKDKAELKEALQKKRNDAAALKTEIAAIETSYGESESGRKEMKQALETSETGLASQRAEAEELKNSRMQHEIKKAEVERDLVNLEEMCWQDIKKTLSELKLEVEEKAAAEAAAAAEGKPVAEAEELEDAVEDIDEPAQPEGEGQAAQEAQGTAQTGEEAPKPRRNGKKWKPVAEMTNEEVEKELEETRESLNRFKAVNLMAEEEFLEHKKRFDFLVEQRKDLRDSINSTQEAIKKIDQESESQFLKAMDEVNTNFKELFADLFKGGNAEVKLLEPDNPLESGVEIIAQPPGKRVQNLSLLSGGEKSLTSMAFMFALFRYRPSPFCFLDEVDAALDDVNLTRFLELMRKIKNETQFIIITHNYKSMQVADYVYGTTMAEPNMSKLLSVKLENKSDEPLDETAQDLYRSLKEDA